MFTRQWLRALLGAGGVVLVVPIGLIIAVAFATTVGGSSLDGLGQVLGGPQVPRGQAVDDGADGDRASELGLPSAPRQRPARPTAGGAPARRGAPVPRGAPAPQATGGSDATRGTPRRPQSPAASEPTPRPTPTPRPGPAPPPAAPAAPVPAPAAPAAAAPPDVVRGAGNVLDETLRPIAPPVADAVGSVVDLLAPPR